MIVTEYDVFLSYLREQVNNHNFNNEDDMNSVLE